MEKTRYFYKDAARKVHFTRAPFRGWTEPTGLLNVRYAIFQRKSDVLFIPMYDLTKETRKALPPYEGEKEKRIEPIYIIEEASTVSEEDAGIVGERTNTASTENWVRKVTS